MIACASLLFVPGSTPQRFCKALATSADIVCLDLEDAVAPNDKASARAAVTTFLASGVDTTRLCVRINPLGTRDGLRDLAVLADAEVAPRLLMVPKTETARDPQIIARTVLSRGAIELIALVETSLGIEAAFEIAASPFVSALMFGSFDYAAECGCTQDWEVLLPVRSRIVAAAAAFGRAAIDSPFADLNDRSGNADESHRARKAGFAGKGAIHPKMIDDINDAFRPSSRELEEARAIVEAFDSGEGRVGQFRGKLIEKPVALRMRRLLERWQPSVSR